MRVVLACCAMFHLVIASGRTIAQIPRPHIYQKESITMSNDSFDTQTGTFTVALLTGLLGAGLMYFLDPDTGAKRRAWVVQKADKGQNATTRGVKRQAQHLSNRAEGAAHTVKKKASQVVDTVSEKLDR